MAPPTWGDLEIASAKGSWLTAADGATYLDFTCGIGVTNTGHCHPKIVRAIQAQAEALLHGQVSIGLHSPPHCSLPGPTPHIWRGDGNGTWPGATAGPSSNWGGSPRATPSGRTH